MVAKNRSVNITKSQLNSKLLITSVQCSCLPLYYPLEWLSQSHSSLAPVHGRQAVPWPFALATVEHLPAATANYSIVAAASWTRHASGGSELLLVEATRSRRSSTAASGGSAPEEELSCCSRRQRAGGGSELPLLKETRLLWRCYHADPHVFSAVCVVHPSQRLVRQFKYDLSLFTPSK